MYICSRHIRDDVEDVGRRKRDQPMVYNVHIHISLCVVNVYKYIIFVNVFEEGI